MKRMKSYPLSNFICHERGFEWWYGNGGSQEVKPICCQAAKIEYRTAYKVMRVTANRLSSSISDR